MLDHLATLLAAAKASGADAADGVLIESRHVSVAVRHSRLSDLERSENAAINLRVLLGKKQASLSTEDIDPKKFPALAERTVAMARLAPEDPYAGLADKVLLAKTCPDLDLYDATEPPASTLIDRAKMLDEIVRQQKGITNVEEGAASWGESHFTFMTSHGFEGHSRSSMHSHSVSAMAGEGTSMVTDYDYAQSRHATDLRSADIVALTAANRTLARVGARKMPTAKIPVVLSPRLAGSLIRNFLGAISGSAVARKTTFLGDALGQQVFDSAITITDNPLLPRGLRSHAFDGEGVAVKPYKLIDQGRLTTWLLNSSAARQLGLTSTGHASRGLDGVPGISASNVVCEAGTASPEHLIADIKEGFYVTQTMGFGVNGLTGDYSQGAAGFWIQNGHIAFPVHEMTIAGNLRAMFKNMVAANDLERRFGIDAPTLRIEGMMVAGR